MSFEPRTPLRVLVTASTPLTRAVVESDLLAAGYDVVLSASLERACATMRHHISAVVSERVLPDGTASELAAFVSEFHPSVPVVVIEDKATHQGADPGAGVHAVLTPPHQRTALVTAIEQGRLIRGIAGEQSVPVSLSYWSLADVLRTAVHYEWSVRIDVESVPEPTTLFFHAGHIWDARRANDSGEGVLRDIIGIRAGWFVVEPCIPTESSRTIHRPVERLLLEGLGGAIVWQRQLADLPGLLQPYRLNLARAVRLEQDGSIARRLARALDGKRTLREGLRHARIETLADAQVVRELFGQRILEPVAGFNTNWEEADREDDSLRPYLDDTQNQPQVVTSGDVVYRKLQAKGRVQHDEWSDLESNDTAAKISKRRWYAAIAVVLLSIAGLSFWAIGQDRPNDIEVQVLDESDE